MRRIRQIIGIVALLVLLVPTNMAQAYTGGLTDGQPWSSGNALGVTAKTDSSLTDGNNGTYMLSRPSDAFGGQTELYVWEKLSAPSTITDYQLLASGQTSYLYLQFYDATGNLLSQISNPVVNGTKVHLATPISGVSQLAIYNGAGSWQQYSYLYEYDVFTPSQPLPPYPKSLLKGLNSLSGNLKLENYAESGVQDLNKVLPYGYGKAPNIVK